MRGQPSVWRRTQKLEAIHGEAEARRWVRAFAAAEGVDPDELWAQILADKREGERLGLRTEEERLAHLARSEGIPVEELRAAVAEVRAWRP